MAKAARDQHQLSFEGGPVYQALFKACPNFTALFQSGGAEFNSVRIQFRGVYDFLAVCKRWGPDGTPEVIFGSGPDFVGAVLGLEAALEQGAWRPDKYAMK